MCFLKKKGQWGGGERSGCRSGYFRPHFVRGFQDGKSKSIQLLLCLPC